jgi:dTDP-4-dehydrorhamnose reductase
LRIVADQFGAPTGAALIADVTAQVLGQYVRSERKENFPSGVFHLAAAERTSWHGYARHIIEAAHRLGIELKATPDKIHAIPATAYPVPAARPTNSSLCTGKLEADFGLVMPDWRGGVDRVIELLAFK